MASVALSAFRKNASSHIVTRSRVQEEEAIKKKEGTTPNSFLFPYTHTFAQRDSAVLPSFFFFFTISVPGQGARKRRKKKKKERRGIALISRGLRIGKETPEKQKGQKHIRKMAASSSASTVRQELKVRESGKKKKEKKGMRNCHLVFSILFSSICFFPLC
jgi:hypothetical protein